MASNTVAQKMKAFQARQKGQSEEKTLEQVNNMTLEELSQETIQFGQAKKGMSFIKAFQDHSWADWFVSHYEKSEKPQHRKFVRFVELTLDAEASADVQNQSRKTQGYQPIKENKKSHAESSEKRLST